MSPNFGSSKFFVAIYVATVAAALAYFDKDVPELVFTTAIAGYHAANAVIKRSRNGGESEEIV